MEHKKKYHGGVSILLVLLFSIFLGCYSNCYAYISSDYLDDTISKFSSYARPDNYSHYGDLYHNVFSNLSDSDKSYILTNINLFLDNYNISNLNDYNCVFCLNTYSRTECYLKVIFCNNSSPNGYEDIAFYNIGPSAFDFKPRTDNMYQITFFLGSTPSIYSQKVLADYSVIDTYNLTYSYTSTIITCPNINCCGSPLGYYNQTNGTCILQNPYGNYIPSVEPEEPEEPSGDTSGDTPISPSGEGGGSGTSIDYTNQLNNINNNIIGITNQISGDTTKILDNQNQNTQTIVNSISGETNKITNTLTEPAVMDNTNITSGDILENFSFMADPYSNFWWDFIDGVELALLGSVRQLPVNWLGYNGYFNLDGLINYPTSIKNILTTVSTVAVVWIMLKWWKVIMDKLTSGDVDEVLEILEEQGKVNITNLF